MSRNAVYAIAALLIAGALAIMAWRAHSTLTSGLPPRIKCLNKQDAFIKAGSGAVPILGTGSMAPFIPPSAPGLDPLKTVVAYASIEYAAKYEDIQPGDLCIYSAEWSSFPVMHQAASKDGFGWIMSGLNNRHSEAQWRVTEANLKGIVKAVYVW